MQVDTAARQLGLVQKIRLGVHADAKAFAQKLTKRLLNENFPFQATKDQRLTTLRNYQAEWQQQLTEWTQETPYSVPGRIFPRQALFELNKVRPKDAMISTDIGNICSVSNSYLDFTTPQSFFAALT